MCGIHNLGGVTLSFWEGNPRNETRGATRIRLGPSRFTISVDADISSRVHHWGDKVCLHHRDFGALTQRERIEWAQPCRKEHLLSPKARHPVAGSHGA